MITYSEKNEINIPNNNKTKPMSCNDCNSLLTEFCDLSVGFGAFFKF